MQPTVDHNSYFNQVNFKKYSAIFGALLLFGILLGCASLLLLKSTTPSVHHWFPISEIGLRGSEERRLYTKSPVPMEIRMYIFHVTNKEDVIYGAKPMLQEIGPYVFEEWKEKFNMTDNVADDTLTFNMKETFKFRPDLSNGLTGNEIITMVHPLIMAKEITVSQADALILIHCGNRVPKLTDPHRSDSDTIRTAQAYLRTLTLVDDIFHICGLSEYTKHAVRYDGVYYDYLIKKGENLKHQIEQCAGFELLTTIYIVENESGMVLTVNVNRKPLLKMVNNAINAMFDHPTDPFWTGRAMDYLFDGIEINCTSEDFAAKAVCLIFDTGEVKAIEPLRENFYKFSVFGATNGSGIGMYEVKRGIISNHEVGQVISFNNKMQMDVWDGDECNRYRGTDSTIFPLGIQKEDGLWMFEPSICMSIGVHYERDSKYLDVPTIRFGLDFGDARNDKKLECYCADPPNDCPRRGTRDLFDCLEAPIVLSLPHFYNADPSLLTQIHSGLNPNENAHSFFMDYETASGNVPNAVKRMQINLDIVPVDVIESMKNLPTVLMPLFWIEQLTASTPPTNPTYTDVPSYEQPILILQIFQWIAIIGGAVGSIFSTYMHIKIRAATTVVHIKNAEDRVNVVESNDVYKVSFN